MMMLRLVICVCLLSEALSYKSYNGYQILRIKLETAADYSSITALESRDLLEILNEGRTGHVEVLIPPHKLAQCQQELQSRGLPYEVTTTNVGREVEKEREGLLSTATIAVGEFTYDTYHRLGDMYSHLNKLAADHSDIAKTFDLPAGTTYEGRNIQAIRITHNITDTASDSKPMLWIDGGIHAREWVSPATVMYIIDSLLGVQEKDDADKRSAIDDILAKFQVVIAPCINPDGYEYSHEKERLWRKTRQPSGCKNKKKNWFGGCFYYQCFGVDPNRNWGADWGNEGVNKDDPCSLVYPGKAAFDQDNTRIVKTYLEGHKDKLKLYVTYHSYSQLFLTPLGYTMDEPPKHEHHKTVGTAVVDAIKARHGVVYTAMQSAGLYPASGDSADWVHDVLGLTDSYTFELRDTGKYGFELPKEQILGTGEENVDGLLALIANIEYNNDASV